MSTSKLITLLVVGLSLTGLVMIGSASTVDAARNFSDKWYYVKLQTIWWFVGICCFFIMSRYPYQKLERYGQSLLVVNLILLALVLLPSFGSPVQGARRWIFVGKFTFQPAELVKLSLCIYFAGLFKKSRLFFQPFLLVLGFVSLLVMLEPDLGTTLVLVGVSLCIYFCGGGPLRNLLGLFPILALVIVSLIFISPYRKDRLFTYLGHTRDPSGSSYHIHQVLLSLGSGGWFGVGIGQSRQKYDYLPEVTTDSIFAVFAEEFGFVGSLVLISAYLALIIQGLSTAVQASTQFGRNLAIGITSWIGLQTFINLSAMVALFPLTGIPLPYISYGGSALVIVLAASGILVNIASTHENTHIYRRASL